MSRRRSAGPVLARPTGDKDRVLRSKSQVLVGRGVRGAPADRGQTLVEFAMVFPMFVTMIMGLIEFAFVFNALLSVNYAARDAALAAAEAGDGLGADCVILSAVDSAVGAPTNDNRIDHVEIYKADPNGGMIGSPTVYHAGAARPHARSSTATTATVHYTLGPPTAIPSRAAATSSAAARRHGGHQRHGRQHRRPGDLHAPLGDPAAQLHRRRPGRPDVRPLERHAHGAGPVSARCRLSRTPRATAPRPGPRRVRDARAGLHAAAAGPARVRLRVRPHDDHQLRHPRGRPQRGGLRQRQQHDDGLHRPASTSTRTSSPPSSACSRRRARGSSPLGVSEIRIYSATSTGVQIGGQSNVWTYSAGAGPVVDGVSSRLHPGRRTTGTPAPETTPGPAASAPDSIGVSITYTYQYVTPLSARSSASSGRPAATACRSRDRTVMALNPTN